MKTQPASEWYEAWPAQLVLLAVATLAVYAHTLSVPFYLDDYSSIRDNSLIYHWQGFEALRRFGPLRVLCYLTFALTYKLAHFQPPLYHAGNIKIHLLAGFAVFGLARGLLRTPRLAPRVRPLVRTWLPAFAAALFLLHPLQTQAVTYTVQRLASMAALFYIAALAAYVQARLAAAGPARALWVAACVACAAAALFTKENTATLPLAFLLVEATLFEHPRGRWAALAGVALAELALVWVIAALAFGRNPFSPAALAGLTSQSPGIPRLAYFATQMPVLWTYLRLFLWPAGLHLDYAVTLERGFTSVPVALALAGHLVLIGLALALARRQPLISFGILFYYLAHAVESSVIPIPELAFEHRTYLPDLGLCLVAGWLLVALASRAWGGRAVAVTAAALLVTLGGLTARRNELWRDPVAFWRDNVRLAPAKARAWGNLGKALLEAGQPEPAANALREALRLQQAGIGSASGAAMDAVNLVAALQMLKRDDQALDLIERLLARPLEPAARAVLDLNRGNIQFEHRAYAAAESSYREALGVEPGNRSALANLASALAQTGHYAAAESLYQRVLDVDPDDQATRINLLQARAGRLIAAGDAARAQHREQVASQAYALAATTVEQLRRLDPGNPVVAMLLHRIEDGDRTPGR